MSVTREDYEEFVEREGKKKLNGERPNLEYLVQAQVKMELLTGDQHWDVFLSYLQSSLEALEHQRIQLTEKLCAPNLVDPNGIMEVKLMLAGVGGQILAVEAIIGLPKAIRESADKAKERLETLG